MNRAIVLLALCAGHAAWAQGAPSTMSFVARLSDSGTPLSGPHDLVFSLFDAPTGGSMIWTENRLAVPVPSDGLLYLDLGSVTTLDATVLGGTKKYLEITVDGVVSVPRVPIESSPYAIRAGVSSNADLLQSHAATDFQLRINMSCAAGSAIRVIDSLGNVTCSNTAYTAGTGLVLTGSAFSVDTTVVQARVASCAPGSYINAVAQDGTVMCFPDLNTQYTAMAGGGLTLTGNAFAADLSILQHRIGTCPAGQAMTSVDAAGNPTCTNATYTAGNGLALSGSQFSIDPTKTQARVTGTCAVGAAITAIAADGTVTCGTAAKAARIDTSEATGSTTYADLATAGPSAAIVVPASGSVMVTVTALITLGGATSGAMGFSAGGGTVLDSQSLTSAQSGQQSSATYLVTGLAAGSMTFTAKYKRVGGVGGANATFANRNIVVTPLP